MLHSSRIAEGVVQVWLPRRGRELSYKPAARAEQCWDGSKLVLGGVSL